jgi:hypothetical protein
MKKQIFILIVLVIALVCNNLFLFLDRGEAKTIQGKAIDEIPEVEKSEDIPKNKSVGDCWNIKEIGKIVCFDGKRKIIPGVFE